MTAAYQEMTFSFKLIIYLLFLKCYLVINHSCHFSLAFFSWEICLVVVRRRGNDLLVFLCSPVGETRVIWYVSTGWNDTFRIMSCWQLLWVICKVLIFFESFRGNYMYGFSVFGVILWGTFRAFCSLISTTCVHCVAFDCLENNILMSCNRCCQIR
jgi:hypothetical protein